MSVGRHVRLVLTLVRQDILHLIRVVVMIQQRLNAEAHVTGLRLVAQILVRLVPSITPVPMPEEQNAGPAVIIALIHVHQEVHLIPAHILEVQSAVQAVILVPTAAQVVQHHLLVQAVITLKKWGRQNVAHHAILA